MLDCIPDYIRLYIIDSRHSIHDGACVDASTRIGWTRTIKGDNLATTNLHGYAYSRQLFTTTDTQPQAHVHKLICVNRCVRQKDMTVMLRIMIESTKLSIKCLGKGMCARWVPCMMTPMPSVSVISSVIWTGSQCIYQQSLITSHGHSLWSVKQVSVYGVQA